MTPAQTAQLRRDVAALVRLANNDLDVLLRLDDTDALFELLPQLIEAYGSAAGTVAADWYDELRDLLERARRFRAIPADLRDTADALVGWALTEATDDEAFRRLLRGGLERRIADYARNTVMGSSIEDPASDGWQRVTQPGGCGFCQMLASRGAVYSETTVNFGAHDNCTCAAVMAWTGEEKPVQSYTPSDRAATDADRARARDWMRGNGYL